MVHKDRETEPAAEACMLSTRSICRFDAEFSLTSLFVEGLLVVAITMPHGDNIGVIETPCHVV